MRIVLITFQEYQLHYYKKGNSSRTTTTVSTFQEAREEEVFQFYDFSSPADPISGAFQLALLARDALQGRAPSQCPHDWNPTICTPLSCTRWKFLVQTCHTHQTLDSLPGSSCSCLNLCLLIPNTRMSGSWELSILCFAT